MLVSPFFFFLYVWRFVSLDHSHASLLLTPFSRCRCWRNLSLRKAPVAQASMWDGLALVLPRQVQKEKEGQTRIVQIQIFAPQISCLFFYSSRWYERRRFRNIWNEHVQAEWPSCRGGTKTTCRHVRKRCILSMACPNLLSDTAVFTHTIMCFSSTDVRTGNWTVLVQIRMVRFVVCMACGGDGVGNLHLFFPEDADDRTSTCELYT